MRTESKRDCSFLSSDKGGLNYKTKNMSKAKNTTIIMLFIALTAVSFPVEKTNSIEIKAEEVETSAEVMIKEVSPEVSYEGIPYMYRSSSITRVVTAYNAGDPAQTDDSPCIGAYGDNICSILDQGQNVCASNAYSYGSVVSIEGLGECIVLDRMNSRYSDRIDWAMPLSQKKQAREIGIQSLRVSVIKN